MTSKWSIIFFFIAMVAATLHSSTARTTHVVGDDLGWTFPPLGGSGSVVYKNWASMQNFTLGDFLVFNFPTGLHDVAELTSKADYERCNTSKASNLITTSPARIRLTTPGQHFFVCTFPRHCGYFGMKLAINVSSTTPPHYWWIDNVTATPPPPPIRYWWVTLPVPSPPSPSSASNINVVVATAMPMTLLWCSIIALFF